MKSVPYCDYLFRQISNPSLGLWVWGGALLKVAQSHCNPRYKAMCQRTPRGHSKSFINPFSHRSPQFEYGFRALGGAWGLDSTLGCDEKRRWRTLLLHFRTELVILLFPSTMQWWNNPSIRCYLSRTHKSSPACWAHPLDAGGGSRLWCHPSF